MPPLCVSQFADTNSGEQEHDHGQVARHGDAFRCLYQPLGFFLRDVAVHAGDRNTRPTKNVQRRCRDHTLALKEAKERPYGTDVMCTRGRTQAIKGAEVPCRICHAYLIWWLCNSLEKTSEAVSVRSRRMN